MVHKIDLIEWDDRAKGTFPLIEELQCLRTVNADLLAACEAVMREDGHYIDCPCPSDYDHAHMPHSKTVHICEALQTAIAKAKGEG